MTEYQYITSLQKVKGDRRIREQMAGFLNRYPWAWWCTLTFEDPMKSYAARGRMENWLETIERKAHRTVPCFIAEEWTYREVPHYHLLVGNVGDLRRDYWWSQWYHRRGNGQARILPYEADKGASHYVCKYLVKAQYDRGYWLARRLPPPEKAKDWEVLPPSKDLPAEAEKVVEKVVAMFDGKRHLVKP